MIKVKEKNITRSWHLYDAASENLGRLATKVANVLMGKNKAIFTPYIDTGDYVVVVNSKKVILSGKKESQKKYYHHSQYPGGLYIKKVSDLRKTKPNELIRHAIIGMLPKTKLGKIMLKKLFVYEDENHPHADKLKENRLEG